MSSFSRLTTTTTMSDNMFLSYPAMAENSLQNAGQSFDSLWASLEDLVHHYQSDEESSTGNSSLECSIDDNLSQQHSPLASPSPPLRQTNPHSVPSSTHYPGHYGFQIAFSPPKKDTKSTTWTYSNSFNKLYVRMATSCPIQFKTASPPPSGTLIRATAIYKEPQHIQHVVTRCPNHASCLQHNESHPAPSHLIRSDHPLAAYVEDPFTNRHSVVIPHQTAQVGSEWTVNLYQFMCLGSCVGGPNRRPMQIVFTLEYEHTVLGRAAVDVRICACPGRDKRVDENSLSSNPTVTKRTQCKRPLNQDTSLMHTKRRKQSKPDSDVFTLTVRGQENYDLLCRLRDSLELAAFLTFTADK
ncbi:cellular tumor antigen p53-like [Liolophura sinensis]|uniref:cellular tumor antigen p53-like n=1 Tax=Liolophura sinensis TaxID=3198878 RepID=UPI003159360F